MKRLLLILCFVFSMLVVNVAQTIENDSIDVLDKDTMSVVDKKSKQNPIDVADTKEGMMWIKISMMDTTKYTDVLFLCKAYLNAYPSGLYVQEVSELQQRTTAALAADEQLWSKTLSVNTIDAYDAYLVKGIAHHDEALNRKAALQEEERVWNLTCKENTENAYERFISSYPSSSHIEEAKTRKEIVIDDTAWEKAKQTNSIMGYYEYLSVGTKHTSEAQEKMDELKWNRCKEADNIPAYEEYILSGGKYENVAQSRINELQRQQDLLIAASASYDSQDFVAAYKQAHEARQIGGLNSNQMARALKYEEEYQFAKVDSKDASLTDINDYLSVYGEVAPSKHIERITKRKEKLLTTVEYVTGSQGANSLASDNYRYIFAEITGAYGMVHKDEKNGDWLLGVSLVWQQKTVGGFAEYKFSMNTNDEGKFRAFDHLVSLGPSFRLVKETATDIHLYLGPALFYNHELEGEKWYNNFMYGGNVGFRFAQNTHKNRRFGWWSVSMGVNVVGSPMNKSVEWIPQISFSLIPGAVAVTTMALLQPVYKVIPMRGE